MDSYLMLRAEIHNWGLMGPGDWSRTVWKVYSDMAYEITVAFRPDIYERRDDISEICDKPINGRMSSASFQKLKKALDKKQWRHLKERIRAFDGEAWKIDYYSPSGEVLNTSGELGYIYGEKHLEQLVRLLPLPDEHEEG